MEPISSNVGDPKGKTRLMITKMVLENFKSYAGQQEIGPFHKRFSSVVGPNGSGKSNVIDALLFVFGKKAKDLRLKKVSGLIHKSSGFPNLEFCKVEVHFQLIYDDEESADDFEVVQGSEFVVSRSADQKNQSKYIVDGKGSTWTEVGVLLKRHGIDTDNNRFLILQGEVEQIAMMKPKGQKDEDGLLEYLEDIIGSNMFVEKIEEIGKTLEDFNDQRVDKVNRLKRADKERNDLSSSKEGAEEFMTREKEIRKRQNILYQVHEDTSMENVRQFATRRDDAKLLLEQERAKKKDGEEQLQILDCAYAEKKAEYEAVSKELAAVSSNFAAYERKDLELQENMKHSKTKIDKLKNDILNDKKKEEDSRRDADEALITVNIAKSKIADFTGNKEVEEGRLEGINEGLREATQELRDRLEGTQAQLAEAERATASMQTEKESAENCLVLLLERSKSAVKTVSITQNKISTLGEEAERATARQYVLEEERKELNRREVALEAQIGSSAQDEESVQSSLRNAIISLEDARATLLSQQDSGPKGRSKELDRLMAAAKKGGPLQSVGLRGRLGDLATIHPEFDVAISTACGFLDYIVVDTPEGGQACISYLREHNIGRANFVVLTQAGQHKTAMERSQGVTFPEGSKRLFDLITPSDVALMPAFYMALKDTLVAKDLDAAVAMAYQGNKPMRRVVTLEGNLIDNSGSMSGGGKSVKSGGMRLSGTAAPRTTTVTTDETITPQTITALEAKVSQCDAQLIQCRTSRKNALSAVRDSKTRLKAIETELAKLAMELSRIEEQIKELSARLIAQRKDTDLSEDETLEIEVQKRRISSLEEDIGRASPDSLTLKRAATSLQQQIRAVGGPKLAEAQAKVERLVAQLLLQNKMMVEKEVVETNSRNQANKASSSRAKAEKELVKAQEKLSAYHTELEEMEEDAAEMIGAMTAATESVETQNEQLKVLMKENDDMNARMKLVRVAESRLRESLEEAERDLDKNSFEARKWRSKLDALRELHMKEQSDFNAEVRKVLKAVYLSNSAARDPTSQDHVAAVNDVEEEVEETLELLSELSAEKLLSGRKEKEELTREICVLETERANQQKSGVNMPALMLWIRKNGEYRLRLGDLEAITLLRNSARKEYETLRGQRLEMFMCGFGVISLKLKEMYQMITLGGDAELELLDSLDPFSEGIVFSVRPPKKSWKNISNLSGGEKTLSSLALVFALHHYKPTPLYVMDEIDAALDFKNVSIVANYIKERTKNAQFIIISLRNNMFELADRLVGIYKTHDATKSVTINPRMFSEAAAIKGLQAERRSLAGSGDVEGAAVTGVKSRVKMALGDATNIF